MKYLLDTVIFLWSLHSPEKLNQRAQRVLETEIDGIFLSPVSSWEVMIKYGRGKLNLPRPPEELLPEAVARFGSRGLPITHSHSLALAQLPPLHSDPFDRMLVAQARSENMVLMTADSLLQNYPVETLWCGK